ncbi:Tetratricopeptide-like helical [Penicillium expansum]|uniref:Tetratricopeptide-like helical n=1 Tax=Penicillium expansum TaxID=27334 RepID=A0A0A2JP22_PENEN|nr:Tetratricopeptide-like helical [Penicillium expansum]KGO56393.1 Tetratricopeptide-like helical [Penicillium expansum]
MSFFDRQGVSEDLLRVQREIPNEDSSSEEITFDRCDEDTDSTSESNTDDEFNDDLTILRDFSFIFVSENISVFTMHRLVQLTVRVWLKTNGEIERWKEEFITRLYQRFPTGKYENWAQCRSLFPHMKSAESQRPGSQDCLHKWATLLYKGAWYARESGNITESRDMASKSRKERVLMFGLEGEHTLNSTAMLASVYRLEGRWEEAEQLDVQVMETRKIKLGVDHPDTLTSMANLALTFWNQGRWEEAGQLNVQVMETSKTKLGVDHPHTLTSMNNMAYTLRSSGQYTAALQLMAECVQLRDRKLGPNHPDTLSSKSALIEWRGKVDSPSSQLTKPSTDTKEASILDSSSETPKRVSRPERHHRRTIFLRLFGRK